LTDVTSKRAWGGDVEYTSTYMCGSCGFAFHGRGLSELEVRNYYSGYRDDEYYAERHNYEPFYTRAVHDAVDSFLGGEPRRNALIELFNNNCIPEIQNRRILDFGGGSGRLIQNMVGDKYVYDVSGESPVDGVTQLSKKEVSDSKFDILVCAQVLEHATDPAGLAMFLSKRLRAYP